MRVSLSVIVPTKGERPVSLARTLASIAAQLEVGDELFVLCRLCNSGNEAREEAMKKASGTHLLFIDDDDEYELDAFERIRTAIRDAPDVVHIFKMRYFGAHALWRDPSLHCGNIGTPMFVVPNVKGLLGSWGTRYEGDFDFIASTLELRNEAPVFHDKVIATIGPPV